MKRYTKKDFLNYAEGFDYFEAEKNNLKKYTLQDWIEHFGFTHKCDEQGTEITKGE